MSREAMKQALEALEFEASGWEDVPPITRDAITTLRKALETEQEPVAWMHNFIAGNVITHIPADIGRHPERWTALYKNPTPCKTCESLAMAVMNDQTYHEKVIPKREWVGLTDEEIQDLSFSSEKFDASHSEWFDRWGFARAIEAKLKDKNV